MLYLFSAVTILLIVGVFVLALLNAINWELLAPKLLELIVIIGLLYWATTLLPGPIKKLGKVAGKSGKKH